MGSSEDETDYKVSDDVISYTDGSVSDDADWCVETDSSMEMVEENKKGMILMQPPSYQNPVKVVGGIELPSHVTSLEDYYNELNTQLDYADITDEDKLEEAYALIRKVGAAMINENTSAIKERTATEENREQLPVPRGVSLDQLQRLTEIKAEIERDLKNAKSVCFNILAKRNETLQQINDLYDQEAQRLGEDEVHQNRSTELRKAQEPFDVQEQEAMRAISKLKKSYKEVDAQIGDLLSMQ